LEDPSRVLKIAADAYPHLRVLATGSSTLSATRKFRDSLTGRKETLYLPPVLWSEARTGFGISDGNKRLLHGGLPEALLSERPDPAFFSEWIDSFYARDVQELFHIRSRTGFLKLLHLLLFQSGGQLDYVKLAREVELSRHTVKSHVDAMQLAHAVYLLPPFSGGGRREILKQPKCYGFDTGFVCFAKGWDALRPGDTGLLWEHCVLDVLRTKFPDHGIHYWREKTGHEVDFVVKNGTRTVDIYECKFNPDAFNADALTVFRRDYPRGKNFVVSPAVKEPYRRTLRGLEVRFISVDGISG
jgi:predicted AAA+ superfamily ATPase